MSGPGGGDPRPRTAVCNELFGSLPLERACRLIAEHGFDGVELAPYTLAADPSQITPEQARVARRTIEGAGLRCAALHWLLRAPQGLHLTTADRPTRRRSWRLLERLVDFASETGAGVMVLGSGRQRSADGVPVADAVRALTDGLAGLAGAAERAAVVIALEALPSRITNVINTLEEAAAVVRAVGSPAVRTMFDFGNTADEREPWPVLIERHFDLIAHVHFNEVDGRHPVPPGRPDRPSSDFVPAFRALRSRGFGGWVSLEIFSAATPAETVLAETRAALAAIETELALEP